MAAPVGEVGGVCREYDPGGPLHMLHARAGGVDHKGVLGGIRRAHQTEHRCSGVWGCRCEFQFNPNIIFVRINNVRLLLLRFRLNRFKGSKVHFTKRSPEVYISRLSLTKGTLRRTCSPSIGFLLRRIKSESLEYILVQGDILIKRNLGNTSIERNGIINPF